MIAHPPRMVSDGFGPSSLDHGGPYVKSQPLTFGEVNFGNAELGDKRRTRRLVESADLMRRRPGGSLPQKFRAPKDLRAFYRLMNCSEVTHEAVLSAHRNAILANLAQIQSTVLILHDATELDFTTHASLPDLGQIGNGNQRGYLNTESFEDKAGRDRKHESHDRKDTHQVACFDEGHIKPSV